MSLQGSKTARFQGYERRREPEWTEEELAARIAAANAALADKAQKLVAPPEPPRGYQLPTALDLLRDLRARTD